MSAGRPGADPGGAIRHRPIRLPSTALLRHEYARVPLRRFVATGLKFGNPNRIPHRHSLRKQRVRASRLRMPAPVPEPFRPPSYRQ